MKTSASTSDATHSLIDNLRRYLLPPLHWLVLAVAVALIAYITYDTLRNITFVSQPEYIRIQLWACVFFEVEIVIETLLAKRRWHALLKNLPFIILCVPYISLIHHYNLPINGEGEYLLRFVPMIRAAYVLATTWGIMSKNWVTSMFGAYIIMLISTLYFLSLMFYVQEHHVNHEVYNYWQSLWYSWMQMTTCGSNVNPITPTGKVIGVVLSAEGLILFPVFTVYFTHAFSRTRASNTQ